nr:PREDICTED: uncharacterized protein LOC109038927 [Bemisia tabaci]
MSGLSAPELSTVILIKRGEGEGYIGCHSNNVFLQLLILLITLKVVSGSGSHHSGKEWHPLYMRELGEGDVLETKNHHLLIAINNTHYVSATKYGKNHVDISISNRGYSDTEVKLIGVKSDSKWSSAKRVALAKRMSGRLYPYAKVSFCRVEDYMKYIVHGTTTNSSTCPLKRNLRDVKINAIESPDFYLEDGNGKKVVVDELPEN